MTEEAVGKMGFMISSALVPLGGAHNPALRHGVGSKVKMK